MDSGKTANAEEGSVLTMQTSEPLMLRILKKLYPLPDRSKSTDEVIPEASASRLSKVMFDWMTPLLVLGYSRPLEPSDLYRLQPERSAENTSSKIMTSFEARRKAALLYNEKLANGDIGLGWRALWWNLRGNRDQREKQWRGKDGQRKGSLKLAMNDCVKRWFWIGGLLRLISDLSEVCSSLVVKAMIKFATESYYNHRSPSATTPSIGRGIGLALGLFAIQLLNCLSSQHAWYRSYSTGVIVRSGLIAAMYDHSLRLTSRARSFMTNGKIINHISSDLARIEYCAGVWHLSWTSYIKLALCLAILIINLGVSALAGFGFLALATPVQMHLSKRLSAYRKRVMACSDSRLKLTQEALNGVQVVKLFGWEAPFLNKLFEHRAKEMFWLRSIIIIRSLNNAISMSIPTLAAALTFITYSLLGNELDASVIFSSLTIFQILRIPMAYLSTTYNAITDANNAINRLTTFFEAETLDPESAATEDKDLDAAVRLDGATFVWDSPAPEMSAQSGKEKNKRFWRKKAAPEKALNSSVGISEKQNMRDGDTVFRMADINMSIPLGKLVAIVGPIGSGKSSLLQGIVGAMRRESGNVSLKGSVSYCTQTAWIQNATIRDNICFGSAFDEERYWNVIRNTCLEADLSLFPDGDLTEVGEKGISLSGGQKQRISICRAIYRNADIEIFDDCLSALDPDVAQQVLQNVLLKCPPNKARILVTHALSLLSSVDYIYAIENGEIVEQGTFDELIEAAGPFADMQAQFVTAGRITSPSEETFHEDEPEPESKPKEKPKVMMEAEERKTGAVSGGVYAEYLRCAKGILTLPILAAAVVVYESATIMSSYWLVYWQEMKWDEPQRFYMGIFAGLGGAQAIASLCLGSSIAVLTYFASRELHRKSITRVMHAPMLFFETNPLGRVMNRFSRDIDTIDNTLGENLRAFVTKSADVIGTIILISIILPWFLIAVAAVLLIYIYASFFYRASARELKRIDAMLRSSLYAHFSESLTGIETIRAYGESERFRRENQDLVDMENRAFWLTLCNQRWLGSRLDVCGVFLTLVVALLMVGTRFTITPSQTGILLAYIISIQSILSWVVRQGAELENSMASVERVVHYITDVPQEDLHGKPDFHPPPVWPSKGRIELKDVVLRYRQDQPDVLKQLSMTIEPGEKIGIVGRTGAGKTSMITALTRVVELQSGSISIDDVNTSTTSVQDLRHALCVIPQESVLFSGTIRSNLDPFNVYDDATLYDALKRSHLLQHSSQEYEKEGKNINSNQFTLESPIEPEGANLSVGQRSLISLARALVKNSRILILDEATASVDFETDRKIQETIASEFGDRTILCIAHRLNTIISYDKIVVMDAGRLAEYDTPMNLYASNGIFRDMCDHSGISSKEIEKAGLERLKYNHNKSGSTLEEDT